MEIGGEWILIVHCYASVLERYSVEPSSVKTIVLIQAS